METICGYAYRSVDQLFAAAVRKSGIRHIRFHDLRHTFGSRLVEREANLYKLSRVMGHASILTTQRYLHLSDADTAQVVEVLNSPRLPTKSTRDQDSSAMVSESALSS
jgi:integrase